MDLGLQMNFNIPSDVEIGWIALSGGDSSSGVLPSWFSRPAHRAGGCGGFSSQSLPPPSSNPTVYVGVFVIRKVLGVLVAEKSGLVWRQDQKPTSSHRNADSWLPHYTVCTHPPLMDRHDSAVSPRCTRGYPGQRGVPLPLKFPSVSHPIRQAALLRDQKPITPICTKHRKPHQRAVCLVV